MNCSSSRASTRDLYPIAAILNLLQRNILVWLKIIPGHHKRIELTRHLAL